MRSSPIAVRALTAGLVLASAGLPSGCGPGENTAAPAAINQEANKKSMNASGDFYKQQHQKKAPAPAEKKATAPVDAKGATPPAG